MRVFRSRRRAAWAGLLFCVLLVAPPAARGADLEEQVDGDESRRLYVTYCGSCHGTSGRGDGPLAELLEIEPTDLTRFAAANGGIFPFRSVLRAIDGRLTVRAHGSSGMPVWGKVFSPPPGASMRDQLEAYGKMFLITFYLESIQEPAG